MRRMEIGVVALYGAMALASLAWISAQGRGVVVAHPSPRWTLSPAGDLLGSAIGGLALAGVTTWSTRLLVRRTAWAARLHQELRAMLGALDPAQIVVLAVCSGVGEELLFRGAMLPAWGLGWSSLSFAVAHVPVRRELLPWTIWTGVVGLALGSLYVAFGSLAGPIVAHAAINFSSLRFLTRSEAAQAATD